MTDVDGDDDERLIPFTEADLREALKFDFDDADEAAQVAHDLAKGGLDRPGTYWMTDTLLLVAMLSSVHEEQIRHYLRWTPDRMATEMQRMRALYAR